MLRLLLPLDYPLTRQYKSKWLPRIAYALGLIVLLILCLLNGALPPTASRGDK